MFRLFIPWYIPYECNTYINKDKRLNMFDTSLFFKSFQKPPPNLFNPFPSSVSSLPSPLWALISIHRCNPSISVI